MSNTTIYDDQAMNAVAACDTEVQYLRYQELRQQGQSHNMAIMLATRSFPGVRTDSTFMRGSHTQFTDHPALGRTYRQLAEAEGASISGQKYLSSLARYPGDPEAWVDGRGDVERVCQKRGWSCDGAVNVASPRYVDPSPDVELAPDLVRKYQAPGEAPEETVARMGPKSVDHHEPLVKPVVGEAVEYSPSWS